ncbi:hypothetical protein D3C84_650480 [compost metagenome]
MLIASSCHRNIRCCPMSPSSTKAMPISCNAGASKKVCSGMWNMRWTGTASYLPIITCTCRRLTLRPCGSIRNTQQTGWTASLSGAPVPGCSMEWCNPAATTISLMPEHSSRKYALCLRHRRRPISSDINIGGNTPGRIMIEATGSAGCRLSRTNQRPGASMDKVACDTCNRAEASS